MATMPNALLANVAGLPYYIPTNPLFEPFKSRIVFQLNPGNEKSKPRASPPSPASLFVFDSHHGLQADTLQSIVGTWLRTDDVFNVDFLRHVYILFSRDSESEATKLSHSIETVLSGWGSAVAHIISLAHKDDSALWRPGPYFASSEGLRPAWRLFPETNGAFVFPVVPTEDNPRRFVIPGTSGVPVPSRTFYDTPTDSKPLSGLRVVIKDVIDMDGVPTSAGNKAYGLLYGVRNKNADCVEKLLDAGAVILGRVKTVQFASGENAKDWFDFQPPFNPRGDGYQDPGCSSAGSATAISAYDWVDVALGTDTFGSVIGPASEHGVFGLRTSLGSISTMGVVPQSRELDTVGLFSRTAPAATATVKAMTTVDISKRFCAANVTLLYPRDIFSGWPPEYLSVTDRFVQELETFLHTKRFPIDIGSKFIADGVGNKDSMQAYLETTTAHIQLYDCYRNCLPFLEEYKVKFGKSAFADPYIQYKWKLGRELTDEQYAEAIHQRDSFRDWMLTQVLPQAPGGQDFDRILVMPSGYMDPFYRHEYDGRTLEEGARRKQGFGFKDATLVVLPGLPFFNIPITQFPYKSAVSGLTEFLPGNIALVGPKGSEVALLQMVEEFLGAVEGFHASVQTGSVPFPN